VKRMMKNSRGFVLAISVFLIVFFALLFTQEFLQKSQSIEGVFSENLELQKSSFVVGNVLFEAASLLNTKVRASDEGVLTAIAFSDALPSNVSSQAILDFKSFAESDFARQNNCSIFLDVARISDGKAELVFSNGLQHDFDYSEGDGRIDFFSASPQVKVSRIDLNIASLDSIVDFNAWQWNPLGNLQVNIYYKDSAVTVKAAGRLDSSVLNSYYFNYSRGSLRVFAGLVNGKSSALRIEQDSDVNNATQVRFTAFIPLQKDLNYYYDSSLKYEQLGSVYGTKLAPLKD